MQKIKGIINVLSVVVKYGAIIAIVVKGVQSIIEEIQELPEYKNDK
ncbi:hypothetical protein [Flavobacterium sp. XGLA_31]